MKALNDAPDLCGPDFTFVATPTKNDETSEIKQSVDCGLYPTAHAPSPPGCAEKGRSSYPAVRWSRIEVSIEVKSSTSKDPFDDRYEDGKTVNNERKEALGQVLAYAQSVFDHQHRTCQYFVLILANMARILRIDRSGLFVTKAFNYKTDGAYLMDFFWRFTRLSAEGRGVDTTARRLEDPKSKTLEEDKKLLEDMKARLEELPNDHKLKLFTESLEGNVPRWVLTFVDELTKTECKFIVGKSNFRAKGVAGRNTKGYVAYDCQKRRLVYLKDSWRVIHDDIKKEGDVLQMLNAAEVPYVPTLAYHGDLGQATLSQDLWYRYHPNVSADARCPLKKHEHYRLVIEEIGKPLSEFESAMHLVAAIGTALEAHEAAYTKLHILHRDISAGNILLVEDPDDDGVYVGMLNDWELAKDVSEQPLTARQPDRTGTWQFLSVAALLDGEKPIVLQDDLESFFHVLLYMAIRFLPHNCPDEMVGKLLHNFFDDYEHTKKGYSCGAEKRGVMMSGQIFVPVDTEETDTVRSAPLEFRWSADQPHVRHPINDILSTLLRWFKAYYAKLGVQKSSVDQPRNKVGKAADPLAKMLQRKQAGLTRPSKVAPDTAASVKSTPESDSGTDADAKNLDSHTEMYHLLFGAFGEDCPAWPGPGEDKTEDKRPKGG
ncbi:hypothetical protein C8Q77DRAFT_1066960 [Trametes polyzona]|nr:hypothetical protein C8Q77DRAFT_1066960 [Trametes polyzona]